MANTPVQDLIDDVRQNPTLMTYAQVAETLAISKPTVQRFIKAGKLQVTYLSAQSVRVTRSSVEALILQGLV